MKEQTQSNVVMAVVVLICVLVLGFTWRDYRRCQARGGALVRATFWYACVSRK